MLTLHGKSSTVLFMRHVILAIAMLLLCDPLHVRVSHGQTHPTNSRAPEWDPYATRLHRLPPVQAAWQATPSAARLELLPPVGINAVEDSGRYADLPPGDVFVPSFGERNAAGELVDGPGGPSGGPGEPNGGPGGFGNEPGGPGGQDGEPGFASTWYPSAAVSGQGTELGILRNGLSVEVPVWFRGADMIMASAIVDEFHFSGDAILPDSLRAFPSDLWNIQLGLKHMRQYQNGWSSILMFDFGSASDKPFRSLREMTVQLGGFLMIPAKNGRDSWAVGAMYSPLGSPNFPIPLLSYRWKPSETFQMNIGIPCSIEWRPTDRLRFDVSYFPLLDVNALATYELSDQLRVYGGYMNVTDSWFLSERVDRNDQFFAIEQRLIIGIRRDLSEKMTLDFNAGYAFNRQFGVGAFQTSLTDQVDLAPGAFLAGRLTWNF